MQLKVLTLSRATAQKRRRWPWPEWVAFVDRLKAKGYFTGTPPKESDVYTDINEVKEASLTFARDRYDVFKCSFMNFSRNIRCLKCKAEGPKRVGTDAVEMKKGDWTCPKCAFMNFASNRKCLRCQDPRPKKNPADWDCTSCDFMNYGRNAVCLKCNRKRPKEETTEYKVQMWRRLRASVLLIGTKALFPMKLSA